jgi:hypothetical protein
MTEKIIDIGADIEDSYFKFPQQAMADIVDALHKNDKVILQISEGVAIEEVNYKEKKFLQILKELCESNNWPLDKIHISLPNLVQDRSVWPSISYGNASILGDADITRNIFLGLQAGNVKVDKDIQKTFGIFIHRSQWDRLLLSSHLYKNHKEITMQTFRKDLKEPANMVEMGLDQLFWLLSCDDKLDPILIQQLCDFVSSLPHNNGIEWQRTDQQATVDQTITGWYNNIFLDIVCEKMVTGQTFFPTEKTARPLATKTPFLIMATPNYIKNLRRLGFKSFSQFWDESYDYQQGVQRIESMQLIIDDVAKLDNAQLKNMYQEMLPILEHNYTTYHSLTGTKISSMFL